MIKKLVLICIATAGTLYADTELLGIKLGESLEAIAELPVANMTVECSTAFSARVFPALVSKLKANKKDTQIKVLFSWDRYTSGKRGDILFADNIPVTDVSIDFKKENGENFKVNSVNITLAISEDTKQNNSHIRKYLESLFGKPDVIMSDQTGWNRPDGVRVLFSKNVQSTKYKSTVKLSYWAKDEQQKSQTTQQLSTLSILGINLYDSLETAELKLGGDWVRDTKYMPERCEYTPTNDVALLGLPVSSVSLNIKKNLDNQIVITNIVVTFKSIKTTEGVDILHQLEHQREQQLINLLAQQFGNSTGYREWRKNNLILNVSSSHIAFAVPIEITNEWGDYWKGKTTDEALKTAVKPAGNLQ